VGISPYVLISTLPLKKNRIRVRVWRLGFEMHAGNKLFLITFFKV
jgi:hypothetical protein